MVTCTGTGANGDHCCYIDGKVCEFLTYVEGTPRCSVWNEMPFPRWREAPVGQMFSGDWEGYTCRDWPQNIPDVMENGSGLCCWQGVS